MTGPATVFTSSTVDHPIDRAGLHALEIRVGADNAFASCLLGDGALAVFADPGEDGTDPGVVIQRRVTAGWVELGRYELWTDAYRALGGLLDEALDKVPIDAVDRPSPTILMAGINGCVEVMFRTADGIRVARELDEGSDPRFEVYDPLWEDFSTATDDEATDAEIRG